MLREAELGDFGVWLHNLFHCGAWSSESVPSRRAGTHSHGCWMNQELVDYTTHRPVLKVKSLSMRSSEQWMP